MTNSIIELLSQKSSQHVITALAPMDGYTDQPFRMICKKFGANILYTEFIHGLDVQQRNHFIAPKLVYSDIERPIGIQIYDNDPSRIVQAAQYLSKYEPDFIDINLGCSISGIKSRGAGAGMLKTPDSIAWLMDDLSTSLPCPVSAKIRLGWDHDSQNYLLVTTLLQDHGAAFVAVHARTAADKFTDPANWQAIREIKSILRIPVIGNGNVFKLHDILDMKEQTACDAVMIGRGAIGNPWVFDLDFTGEPAPVLVLDTMLEHLHLNLTFYGDPLGLILFRKHVVQYLNRYNPSSSVKRHLLTLDNPSSFIISLREYFHTI